MADTIIRDAWLFRAGDYPDKGVNATSALLDSLVTNGNSSLTLTPMDLEHGPTERVLPFGRLVPGSLRRVTGAPPSGEQGEWVVGQVEIDRQIDQRLTARGLSVTLDTAKQAIRKVAVTATPRVAGAQFSGSDGLAEFHGGYLMPETPIVTTPEAPAEETRIAGIVGAVLSKLGLGHKPEPEATSPEPAQAFTAADIEKRLAEKDAEFAKQLAAVKADADAAKATAREQEVKAFSAELVSAGVPPYLVDALARHADTGAVTFSDTDKPGEFDAAKAIRFALEKAKGTVPMKRILPGDDASGHEASFSDTVDARAAELMKADSQLTRREAILRAVQEVS